jgi:hypothetical protein
MGPKFLTHFKLSLLIKLSHNCGTAERISVSHENLNSVSQCGDASFFQIKTEMLADILSPAKNLFHVKERKNFLYNALECKAGV